MAEADAEIVRRQIDELDNMIARLKRLIARWPELNALNYGLRLCEQEKTELQAKLDKLNQS
jgi:hypothetical protein